MMSTRSASYMSRRVLSIASLIVFAIAYLTHPGSVLAESPHAESLDSLGLTNPGNASVLVATEPGSSDFAGAVRESYGQGNIVFAFAEPDELVAALPGIAGAVSTEKASRDDTRSGHVLSCYGRTLNGTPILCVMDFPKFRGTREALLKSRELDEMLVDFDERYVRNPEFVGSSEVRTERSIVAATSAVQSGNSMSATGTRWLTPAALYSNQQPYGYVNTTLLCAFITNDSSTTKDYYVVHSQINVTPGICMWPATSQWQTHWHRYKFEAYPWDGSGVPIYSARRILQAGPSTTGGQSTWNVNLGTDGVSMGWSYGIPDVVCGAELGNMPTWAKWTHNYAYNTNSSRWSTQAEPGILMEVGQGKYCKMHIVGTNKWHYQNWPIWHDSEVSNVFNRVVMWLG